VAVGMDRSARTRAALLTAAQTVFAAKGYRDANVDDIVAAAGRARGTFYLHFENKESIFAALLEEVSAEMAVQARSIWQADRPFDSVLASIRTFLDDFAATRQLWRLFDEVTVTNRELRALRVRWMDTFAARVQRGIQSAPSDADALLDPRVSAHLLAGMLDEVSRLLYLEGWERDPDTIAVHLATVWARTVGYPAEHKSRDRGRSGKPT
jgi:AcrR family transcriptional regulator